MKKRLLAILLTVMMVIGMIPLSFIPVAAAGTLAGAGTADNPYLIANEADYNTFRDWMNTASALLPADFPLVTAIKQLRIDMVCGYAGYYMLGHYIHKYGLCKSLRITLYILGAASAAFTVTATASRSLAEGAPSADFLTYSSLNVALYGAAVFTLFKSLFGKEEGNKKLRGAAARLSPLVFGAYLSHIFVNTFFIRVENFTALSFNPIFAVPAVSLSVMIISLAVSFVIKRIPIIGKYIV